jgi:hypothetical protein
MIGRRFNTRLDSIVVSHGLLASGQFNQFHWFYGVAMSVGCPVYDDSVMPSFTVFGAA